MGSANCTSVGRPIISFHDREFVMNCIHLQIHKIKKTQK